MATTLVFRLKRRRDLKWLVLLDCTGSAEINPGVRSLVLFLCDRFCKLVSSFHYCHVKFVASLQIWRARLLQTKIAIWDSRSCPWRANRPSRRVTSSAIPVC
ncbi:hypothetical protein AVEN_15158-1 [Araneus ventricosus]|uniref:Uncharacterized protein n=1 Tax=Araneus ventricosus TaxID=182803 RepID=A0A4Y2XAF8_ARAVE|nr:hypothetical protein AVEN_15158-1 [Araneus ventricosus]